MAEDNPLANLNLRMAAEVNPDEAAQNAAMAKRFGMPISAVEADRATWKARSQVDQSSASLYIQSAFKTQDWLARDPQNAKVASDDIGTLGAIESAIAHPLTTLKNAVKKPIQALDNFILEDGERPGATGILTVMPAGIAAMAGDPDAAKALSPGFGKVGAALKSGAWNIAGALAGAIQGLNDVTRYVQSFGQAAPDNWWGDIGQASFKRAQAAMPQSDSWIGDQVLAGVANLPQTAVSLAGGLGARAAGLGVRAAAAIGSGFGSSMQGGQSYLTARAQGLGVGAASIYAATDAATEFAGEYFGEKAFLNNTGNGASIMTRYLKSLLPEVAGEEFSTIAQDFSAWVALPSNKDKTLGDFFAQLPEDMASTAIQTMVAHGTVNVTVSGLERAMRLPAFEARREAAQEAFVKQQQEHLTALMGLAEQSKLRERDPVSFHNFMQTATEDGALEHVYVDGKALAQTLETDPAAAQELLAKVPSLNEQLVEAVNTDGDVRIPTSELVTALPGSPLEKQIVDHLRVDPMAQSAAERAGGNEAAIARVAETFRQQAAAQQMTTEAEASRDKVTQSFVDQLNSVGRFTPATNEQYANLLGNFFAVQGAKIGLSAEEMAQRYPLEIRSAVSATQLPNRMDQNATYLNVGLSTAEMGNGSTLSVDQVREALLAQGVEPQEITIAQSATEPTAIVRLASPLTPEQGHAVSAALKQEAIAQRTAPGKGDLFGPKAEAWGPFNDNYFVLPDQTNRFAQSADPRVSIIQGQLGKTIDHLLELAAANQQRLAEMGARLRQQFGVEFVNPGPKKAERVRQKFEQGGYEDPGELTDLSRGACLVQSVQQAESVIAALHNEGYQVYDKGWVRTEVNYTDRKLILRAPNGGVIEFQIRPIQIAEYAGGAGHKLYAIWRNVENGARERASAFREMARSYAALLEGSDFAASANSRPSSAEVSGAPSDNALATNQAEAGFQAPAENTQPLEPSTATGRSSTSNNFIGNTSTIGDKTVAVNDNGKPLTLYHGTPFTFDTFRSAGGAVWFSEKPGLANQYADPRRVRKASGGQVIPVHLNVTNPLRIEAEGSVADPVAWAKDLGLDLPAHGWQREGAEQVHTVVRSKAFADAARAAGFDAIVQDENGAKTWGALNENSVVSALDKTATLFQGERGFIEFGKDITSNPSVITLLNASDLSTLLHESGHFFLEVMANMASRSDASVEIVRDMNAALKWMGVDGIAQWEGMTLEEKREHHEKFARGFEAYLFEGKAPNFELRSLFRTFKAWLIAVYRNNINRLNAPLNAEVRGVFNRMLGSADSIAEAQRAAEMAPFFDTKPASMTDAEWRDYQALGADATAEAVDELQSRSLRDMRFATNAKSRELKRLQKETAANRTAVEEEVRSEQMQQPVYAALEFIARGEINGVAQDGDHFLNADAVNALYGENEKADRDAAKKRIGFRNLRREGGVDPAQVAEAFGFGSAREMLNAITASEPLSSVIEGLTDSRMLERYGDINSPEALERAATDAIHNEVRMRFVATELSAIDKSVGKPRDLARAARQYAKDLIGRLKLREVKPSQFEAAERRAGRAAEKARKANDLPMAAQAKRNQLLNMFATREARRAIDETNSTVNYFRKFSRKGVRENLDADYLDQIDGMLARFDFRVTGLDEAQIARQQRKAALADWIADQRESGFEPIFANEPLFADENRRKNYRDMTIDEMRGLRDAIKNIEFLARARHQLLKGIEQMALAEAKDRGAAAVTENSYKIVKEPLGARTWLERAKSGVNDFLAMHRKFSSLIREMDGNVDRGQLWRLFSRPMNAASDLEATMTAKATKELHEIFEPILHTDTRTRKYEPAIDRSISLETRLSIALNMGNPINLERIMSGENWTPEQVHAVVAPLTSEQWRFVQNVWDNINSYWGEIAAKQKRVTGVAPEKVEGEPITVRTSDGEVLTLPGGYYPIKYDPDRSSRAEADTAAEIQQQLSRGLYTAAQTRRGHTKARVDSTGRPLRYDFGVAFEHVQQVVHDLAWHETLIDLTRLLRNGPIDVAIRRHYGPETIRWMRKGLEDIAIGGVGAANSLERGINYLRTGATVAGLGWNLMTSLMQPLGLTNSVARIGPKYVARGVARAFTDAASLQNTATWVAEQSEFMRLRGQTQMREIAEIRQNFDVRGPIRGAAAKVPGAVPVMDAVSASFFVLIEKAQKIADIPTWAGAYEKAIDQGEDHAAAVAFADQAVRDSQGGGQIADLSGIQRGGPLQKLWTNFYSWFNVAYNQLAESTNQVKRVGPSQLPLLAVDFMLIAVMPSLMMSLVRGALAADDPDKLFKRIAGDQISGYLSFVIGLREVGSMFGAGNDYQGPAGARAASAVVNLGKQVQQGQADEAFWKAVNNAAGILFHYPSTQVQRTVTGIEALHDGQSKNPLVVLTGPPPKNK